MSKICGHSTAKDEEQFPLTVQYEERKLIVWLSVRHEQIFSSYIADKNKYTTQVVPKKIEMRYDILPFEDT